MIADLKPYPEYKDSGLPWLGRVPSHWEISPFSAVARLKSLVNQTQRELLSVYLQRGVVKFSDVDEKRTNGTSEDLSRYQAVDPGDFVLNNQQAWRGSVGVSAFSGIVSPAYLVLSLTKRYLPQYANFLFRDQCMVSQYLICSKGVGSIQRNLYWPQLKRVAVPIPPPSEQAAIVRFLDWANGRLERAIRAKRKVIALIHEQRQAIIHKAVTQGLDPNVPKRDSGIPWLGEIPAHWEVKRAKYLFTESDERSAEGNEELLSVSHLTGVTPRSQKNITMFKAQSYAGHKLCREDDLVVNTMWAWMGALGTSRYRGIISPAYAVYRPRKKNFLVGGYIENLLRTKPYISNIICRSTGLRLSRLRLYPDMFFRLPVILPPYLEQQKIMDSVAAQTERLTIAIDRYEREITLLREYRTRLVADLVTGKLDVREMALSLPEEDVALASEDAEEEAEEPEMEVVE
jgi:type I restriction enzyme S subunit